LRVVVKMGTKSKLEVPMYEGNLNVEELLEWVSDLDQCYKNHIDEKIVGVKKTSFHIYRQNINKTSTIYQQT
jgi:hypothetical protein